MWGLYFVVAFAPKPEMWATAGELGKEPVVAQTPRRPQGWRPLCLVGYLKGSYCGTPSTAKPRLGASYDGVVPCLGRRSARA